MSEDSRIGGQLHTSVRSPLRAVLYLGSAKDGVGHWWTQRVTSVALIFLGLWFGISLLMRADFSYDGVIAWLSQPVTAVLMTLFVLTSFYHSKLGVQVIVEDYVAHHGLKIVVMLLLNFLHALGAALAVFAILRVAFGGAA